MLFGPNDPGYSVDTMREHFARHGHPPHRHAEPSTELSTIVQALTEGVRAAKLAYLGKTSGLIDSAADTAKLVAFGQGPHAFVEGAKTFAPGGSLHWKNVLWPSIPGRPFMQAAGRAGSLMTAAALPSMMRQDAGEGRMSRLLGGVGGLAGMMYGGQAGGLVGTPIGIGVGKGLGHFVGRGLDHVLGTTPRSEYP